MLWITKIEIDNYRAFPQPQSIDIPFGKNVLIYGENGSGKSSIYKALKDFLETAYPLREKPSFAVNIFENRNPQNGYIRISTSDSSSNPSTSYSYSEPDQNSTHRVQPIQLAKKINGFLDYKRLLKIQSFEIPEDKEPDLFNLFIKDILGEHLISNPYGGTSSVELAKTYHEIVNSLLNNPRHSHNFKNAERALQNFNQSLTNLLQRSFLKANNYLNTYFKNGLQVDSAFRAPSCEYVNIGKNKPRFKKKIIRKLNIKPLYLNEPISNYRAFLNEARMSALSICLYLGSIKTYPQEASELKILFLDDIFIGMDTSNRYPLLRLIKDEFINSDYQVFISTYDREWLEQSRHWFELEKCPFHYQEFFIGKPEDDSKPDFPVILTHKSYLERAREYFKIRDYSAAGNYLRKECESIIKSLLLDEFKIDVNGSQIEELENLLKQLEFQFEQLNIRKPEELLKGLRLYRKSLLNPSSHDDIKSPFFRKEIEDAFNLIEELKKLEKPERYVVLRKGQELTIEFEEENYKMFMENKDQIFITTYNGNKAISLTRYFIKSWEFQGLPFGKFDNHDQVVSVPASELENITSQARELSEIFRGIELSTRIPIPENLEQVVRIGDNGSLEDLIK
jgi:energy-coupling factor transporter ATP-binding protein EcfA2